MCATLSCENDFEGDSVLELEPAGLSLGQAFTKKLCHAGSFRDQVPRAEQECEEAKSISDI